MLDLFRHPEPIDPAKAGLDSGHLCRKAAEIIEENWDLITVRNCCCRTRAGKCHHPINVCMQFKARAGYHLSRDSGRKERRLVKTSNLF